jgi:CelD/BcsL family acetyltransferase involved in cellulose biosynthesis
MTGLTDRDTARTAGAVLRVDPRTDPRWRALALGPGGSLFTSPPWLRAVSTSYGFAPQARLAVDGGGVPVGGTAWVDVDDLRGRRRLSLPFSDRADPVAPDPAGWTRLAEDALAGDLPYTLRCLAGSPACADPRLTVTATAAWHETPLTRPLDELYRALRPQARRAIAAAGRAGVEVRLSDQVEAVAVFHRLHVELRKRKYRLLAQPLEFFLQIWAAFAPADGIRTALAVLDGQVVAGALYLVWGDRVYYKFGASLAEFLRIRPNDALHWEVLRWAHARRLRALDWGLSDLDQPGLCAYKRKWASTEGRIVTLNAGGPPAGTSADAERTLRVVTELFTDPSVPHSVTERAGAELYRYFC